VARDISDLKQAQFRMHQLATHDYLTGLPNRVLLYDHLDQALARHQRHGQSVALLYLDLDRFKPINDSLGHHVGDLVLVALSDRIHSVMRETDTPARIGGDEFAVLVENFEGPEVLENVAARLIEVISAPIMVEGETVSVGVSIGMVEADASTPDADALLARADRAMYAAKASGRGRFVLADETTDQVSDAGVGRLTFTDAAAVDAAWAPRAPASAAEARRGPARDLEPTVDVDLGVEPSPAPGAPPVFGRPGERNDRATDVEAVLALVVNDFAETRAPDAKPRNYRIVAPLPVEVHAPAPSAPTMDDDAAVTPDVTPITSVAPAAQAGAADVDDVDDVDDDEIVTPWFLSVIEDDDDGSEGLGEHRDELIGGSVPAADQGPAGPTGTADPTRPPV